MANIFVTYADSEFREASARIRRRAGRMRFFDEVCRYSPGDLPEQVLRSPLFRYKRGGGYWCWKPFVIMDALSKCKEGDAVFYADSGCVLNPASEEWNQWSRVLQTHNAIFFQYRSDVHYTLWSKYCKDESTNNPKILHWTKPFAAQWLTDYIGDDRWLQENKVWGGACIIKKSGNFHLVDEWFRITMEHPEILIDQQPAEGTDFPHTYNEHRHDQVLLTALIHKYKSVDNILVLPETAESSQDTAAICAVRYRTGRMTWREKVKFYLYMLLHPDF